MKLTHFSVILLFAGFQLYAQQPLAQGRQDDLFSYGLDLVSHSDYGAARDIFTRFMANAASTDPRKTDAEYYAAFCAVNLYHADGEKQIEDFVTGHPEHPHATTAYFDIASLFYQQKNYAKASAYFERADFPTLTKEQQNTGRFRWGYSLFNLRKLNNALDQFNFIKAQGGQYGPASSYYAGFIEYNNKDYPNALIDLKRAEQNSSYATIVPHLIAQVLYKQDKYDELISYVKSIEGKEGIAQKEEIALVASEVYFKKGEYVSALKGYQEYLEGKTNPNKNVIYRAGYSAMRTGDDQQAINYFETSALGSDSVTSYSSYFLGSLYLKTNQKPLALTAFDVARKSTVEKQLAEESSFQFAKIAYDLGRADQAIEELEKFQLSYSASDRIGEVKEILSHAYLNASNFNKAIEYLESLPRRNPTLDKAYQKATYLKGMELFNMERYPEAISFFEKSVQYPLDATLAGEAHFWCGEAYSIGRKYEQSIEHYAAIVSPSSGTEAMAIPARYGLGYSYFNMKQYDRALFNFREFVNKAPKDNPNLADGLLRLADCYYVSKSYNEALTTYRKVLQSNSPDKDYAHVQAGVILGIQRKYAEATAELEQAARNYPQSNYREEAMFQIAQLEFEQGKYSSAVTDYTKVIESNQASKFVPYAYMRRAAAYYNLKDYQKTSSDYIAVIENYPTHPVVKDALVPLQEALGLAGRSSEFDQFLNKFKTANPDAKGIESLEFQTASNLYFSQDYAKAIQNLTTYITNYPESPRVTEAKFYRSESYYRQKNLDKALEGYYEIGREDAFSMISKVVGRIAELEFKNGKYELAVKSFARLASMAGNKKEQYTAWSGLMESHYWLAQYDSADVYARIILEKGNINAGAVNKASLFLGKTAMARGDYNTAKDEFLNTLNSAQDEYGAEAKYLIAEILYLAKDHKASNETLFSLISDFASYTEWVGRAYLLLADNYLALDDEFQARATLNSIIDNKFPLQNITDQAAEKLRKLDEEKIKKEALEPKDSTDNK